MDMAGNNKDYLDRKTNEQILTEVNKRKTLLKKK